MTLYLAPRQNANVGIRGILKMIINGIFAQKITIKILYKNLTINRVENFDYFLLVSKLGP